MKIQRSHILQGGSPWNDIRVFNNQAPNNPSFWNRYILTAEFLETITFIEVTD